jgi:hypothetical protein
VVGLYALQGSLLLSLTQKAKGKKQKAKGKKQKAKSKKQKAKPLSL